MLGVGGELGWGLRAAQGKDSLPGVKMGGSQAESQSSNVTWLWLFSFKVYMLWVLSGVNIFDINRCEILMHRFFWLYFWPAEHCLNFFQMKMHEFSKSVFFQKATKANKDILTCIYFWLWTLAQIQITNAYRVIPGCFIPRCLKSVIKAYSPRWPLCSSQELTLVLWFLQTKQTQSRLFSFVDLAGKFYQYWAVSWISKNLLKTHFHNEHHPY